MKNKKPKKKEPKMKFIYKFIEDNSKEGQRRIYRAFDILFNEVLEQWQKEKINKKSEENGTH